MSVFQRLIRGPAGLLLSAILSGVSVSTAQLSALSVATSLQRPAETVLQPSPSGPLEMSGRAGPPGAPPPHELAAQLQTRYDAIRDFRADFIQTYRGGVLRTTTTEQGRVEVKKPGRMRWTYTSPEEKLFVADGSKMYVYVPADRQVMVRNMPQTDSTAAPVLFLVGRGDLSRDFTAEYATVPGSPPGTWALRLIPREPQSDYEWLALVVDPGTLVLRSLVALDGQGGLSTFTFTNLQENVGLSDDTFSFRIPRGVDVITEG